MSTRSLIPDSPVAKTRAVTRVSDLLLQRKCACASSGPESKCEECEKKKFQCRTTGNGPSSTAAPQSSQHPEPRSGHDFSKLRVQSTAEQESLSSSSPARRSGQASGPGSIEEKVARLKDHYFLCPPTADTLTNVSKGGGDGGTLGFTKIDQSSSLICAPKFDIDAKAGTCSFKPVATNLSLTSKFSSPTPESITSDVMQIDGCPKPVPIFGKLTQDISDLAKQGEQEHCDDLTISFNQTLKPCTAAVNQLAGHVFKGKTEDECFKALTSSLGFDPINCSLEFADLTKKDDERDNQGMHDFDPVLISKDCTKIVIGYKKSAKNKIGDPGVAPAKFIPAASKCGKAAPAATSTSTAPPGGSATTAPPPKKDQGGK
ncbi:MAG TPA: hypothetical protein VFR24_10755 [Candidatus Angelobacter sp.]|nr:hypothetical protein [Candidatus Angelobacter sp.]